MGISYKITDWLPTSVKEVRARGWDELDVILFSGDAYVDHPSFGAAVIGRLLEAEGLRVAIVPQPNWRDDLRDFRKLGKPRLFFGVSAGSMDSMVNHYTANKRLRSDDAYTPGGKAGFRPDYAVTVYTRILKRLFPDTPVVIGGIEASLRRAAHYDYWSDSLKPSVLVDSGADLLTYGMGERVVLDIARAMHNGYNLNLLRKLRQVAFLTDDRYVDSLGDEALRLHGFEKCLKDRRAFGENFVRIETESNRMEARTLVEPVGDRFVVINPPYPKLSEQELDHSFGLPYTRLPHPRYNGKGDIPAYEMIKFSVNLHRGCFGGCSFCTISAHQGKFVSSRSEESVLDEVRKLTRMPGFKGYISDLGGPSANMYRMGGRNEALCRKCSRPSCIYPSLCRNLNNDHRPLMELYRKVDRLAGVKKSFIGSGIRYDLFGDNNRDYLREVVVNHVSGRLKVAPEHTEDGVLRLMRKPSFALFRDLNERFQKICRDEGLNYQLIPYFISSHPGCTERDMRNLAAETRRLHFRLEQVQDLTPTPMTLSSVMFYTGENPYTDEKVYVARSQDEKRRQKSYFFGWKDRRGER
ncbi:uncharacterized radical SAM protein YgiQ [Alistipes sp. cv1]|nr:uncharacterized radical SAM protein YgiQ [Faecalibacterium prausnitzii]